MDKRELDNYNEIYNVLNQIEVKGHTNVRLMNSTLNLLATLMTSENTTTQRVPVKDK